MPATLHLDASKPGDIARAADLVRSGDLVAFATETVYGLGANALDPAAVARIFAAKQRPAWDPLIVHIADVEQIAALTHVPPHLADRVAKLANLFWPGPLTLLLPKSERVPAAVTAGRDLVGLRIPAHPAAQALLRAAGCPIAAPSANRFGHTSPTTAEHVLADLDGRIAAVLDAGPTTIGVESTVLDPTQNPMLIYRPGAVTPERLQEALGARVDQLKEHINHTKTPESLPSPGVGLRHYAPRARLVIVEPAAADDLENLLFTPCAAELNFGRKTGVLLPNGWSAPPGTDVFAWGNWGNPEQLAQRVFAGLRSLDDRGAETIVAPLPPPGGLGDALRDRLRKAAKPR